MITWAIGAMLLAGAVPDETRIDVGRIDLEALPAADLKAKNLPTPAMVSAVEQILADGKCKLPGQTNRSFDIDVPYAVLLEPDGSSKRVVVADLGCPDIEALTGVLVLQLARQREYGLTGQTKATWYGSTLNFNLQ